MLNVVLCNVPSFVIGLPLLLILLQLLEGFVRAEALIPVTVEDMSAVYWDTSLQCPLQLRHFGWISRRHLQSRRISQASSLEGARSLLLAVYLFALFIPEDGGSSCSETVSEILRAVTSQKIIVFNFLIKVTSYAIYYFIFSCRNVTWKPLLLVLQIGPLYAPV